MPDENTGGPDPGSHLLTILAKKFEMVSRDMTQTLLKSARSGIINTARDFSSAITLSDGRLFMIDEGLPVHLGSIHLIPQETRDYFDDISPGDCFLTNTPYAGNTHHADYTLHVPVFYDDEFLFWTINRAHQADVGAPIPSTYLGEAKTIYEEGPHLPAVRIQEDYEDRDDIVRMLKLNIRASETQWYGDYRAQIAAVRTGEEEIHDLCDEYGVETIRSFIDDWLAYGEQMMTAEIGELPATEFENTSYHDPIPGVIDEPIPVNVKVAIHPDEGEIRVDVTDNIANLPCGFNLSEATTTAAVYGGILQNLDSTIPHNHGSMSRVTVEMDEGKLIGEPEYPVGTGAATTNVACVLFNAVQGAFGDLGEPFGLAEGNPGLLPFEAVVSGEDFRRDDEPFVNGLILAAGGGPAVAGHDGWMTYTVPVSCGVIRRDSVEIDEQKYPILFSRHERVPDSGGTGKWRGAPSFVTEYEPRGNPLTAAYLGAGHDCPPAGICGGGAGHPGDAYKITDDGERVDLPIIVMDSVEITPGETIGGLNAAGGGYGDPYERDPEAVRRDVEEEYVTVEGAREDYGVVIEETDDGLSVDETKTHELRSDTGSGGAQ